jgi:RNA polymerase sigma-70 factor, ECF subfamily
MTTTSISLLERLRRPGEQDGWRGFVGIYTPLIYYWARQAGLQQAGLQQQDAADLAQEVFAHLFEKMPGFVFDPARRFRAWLRTVTLNLLRDRARRRGDRTIAYGEQGLDAVAVPDGAEALVEEDYQGYLVKRALQVMRADFTEATWQACWRHAVEGRPAADVARELGITVGAVYAARFRVLGRLREELRGLLE